VYVMTSPAHVYACGMLPAAKATCLVLRLAADTTPPYHMRASLSPHCFRLLSARGSHGLSSLSPDEWAKRDLAFSLRAR
jgi:hypothetical protein